MKLCFGMLIVAGCLCGCGKSSPPTAAKSVFFPGPSKKGEEYAANLLFNLNAYVKKEALRDKRLDMGPNFNRIEDCKESLERLGFIPIWNKGGYYTLETNYFKNELF